MKKLSICILICVVCCMLTGCLGMTFVKWFSAEKVTEDEILGTWVDVAEGEIIYEFKKNDDEYIAVMDGTAFFTYEIESKSIVFTDIIFDKTYSYSIRKDGDVLLIHEVRFVRK